MARTDAGLRARLRISRPILTTVIAKYFQRLKASPGNEPYIGFPVHSRLTGEWIVPVARAFRRRDGSFAGLVNATVDVSYFAEFYQQFDVGELGSIVLLRRDGRILERSRTTISAATCPAASCSPSSCPRRWKETIAPCRRSITSIA